MMMKCDRCGKEEPVPDEVVERIEATDQLMTSINVLLQAIIGAPLEKPKRWSLCDQCFRVASLLDCGCERCQNELKQIGESVN